MNTKPETDPHDKAYPSENPPFFAGLTKRELLAAMAMQGICSSERYDNLTYAVAATEAVNQADALIAALNS